MPERKPGQPLNEFISEFMGDKRDERKWPDQKRRLAIAYAEARKSAKKREKHAS